MTRNGRTTPVMAKLREVTRYAGYFHDLDGNKFCAFRIGWNGCMAAATALRDHRFRFSISIAIPWPPPRHIEMMP